MRLQKDNKQIQKKKLKEKYVELNRNTYSSYQQKIRINFNFVL